MTSVPCHLGGFVVALLSYFALPVSGHAEIATRSWTFDIPAPGTYEVHVQHRIDGAPVPRAAEVSYTLRTSETTLTRTLPFYPKNDTHPAIVLIADISRPQKAELVISGIHQTLLKQTRAYIIDANSRYPYEWFDPEKSIDLQSANRIRDILEQPEHKIDLAKTKLIIDKLIDSRINVDSNLRRIDTMVEQIKTMTGFSGSPSDKLKTLKRYIYVPGTWNSFQPFQYDLADPMGDNIHNKLLPTYLSTKKGNCITMPFLFIILAQRLGIEATASTAPAHVFVKVKDETDGAWYNLETTSGADPTRDAWLRQQLPMSDKAIANGVYLQPLTKKETVALMAVTLAEHHDDQKESEKLITLADLILQYYPKHVSTMIMKANAYYDLMTKYYSGKYPSPNNIPQRALGHYHYLSRNNKYWAARAMELGWQQWRKEDDERYLQSIMSQKSKTMN
ncbi:MAG: transglutaminase family protein [Bacteroidota bacterium]